VKHYKYILLDWDGNLAKTLDIWLYATRVPLERRGIRISDKQIAIQCFGRPIEAYAELGVKDVGIAITEMDELAKKMLPEVELYPDALYVLEKLKNSGRQIALITTSLRENVLHLLDKYQIHHYFDVVIANEDTNQHKPHPEPIIKALEELKGSKDKSVMIGDSDKDIGAANNALIDSILFYPDSHEKFYDFKELKILNPTHIVHDFRDIIDIV
jgi:pyrophosphatase PpaX